MPDKRKLHFFQLVIIFGAITVLALAYAWGNNRGQLSSTSMMGQSMGNMMRSMHLQNVTMGDLLKRQEQQEQQAGGSIPSDGSHGSHHNGNEGFLEATHLLTTAAIVVMLPFIIAGTVFLAILWLK
jgi:hypothetical protein